MERSRFAFVVDAEERKFLDEAYRACEATHSWNALSTQSTGRWTDRALRDFLGEMDMREHSGHSASWTLHQLRIVAREGLQQYKRKYLDARREQQ